MKFIDLGLPSGTLWADRTTKINGKDLILGSEIPNSVNLPTIEQVKELLQNCSFCRASDNSFTCTGSNGHSIVIQTAGWARPTGITEAPDVGYYWLTNNSFETNRGVLYFYSPNDLGTGVCSNYYYHSLLEVRLQDPLSKITIF